MKRITMDMSEEVYDRLGGLRDKFGAGTLTEAFRRALAIADTVIDEEIGGGKVLLEASDGSIRQLVIR